MDKLTLFTESKLKSLLKKRTGDSKFGECIKLFSNVTDIYEQLKNLDVDYVLFGISDDVNLTSNTEKTSDSGVWNTTLKFLLNTESNRFINPEKVLILGHLDFHPYQKKIKKLSLSNKNDIDQAQKLVAKIDKHVTQLVFQIVKSGKTPIIVGSNQNNTYPNLKGTSLALQKPVNVVNFSSHSNFGPESGRHAGNGFTYAKSEGFLENYFCFGLHEYCALENNLKIINSNETLDYLTFEDIAIRKKLKFKSALKKALSHINTKPYGIEINCNAIQDIKSRIVTPSGFNINKSRVFIEYFGKAVNAKYLHICEAKPVSELEKDHIGKSIAIFITDFIKAHAN